MADKATGFVALFAIPLQHCTPLYLICLSRPLHSPPLLLPPGILFITFPISQIPPFRPLPFLLSFVDKIIRLGKNLVLFYRKQVAKATN